MKELGEYLKEIRKKNCVSIEEASDDLKFDTKILENVENGNSKAFKDVLELKDIVKKYAKYLGLDPEKVVDEFNDFLFEHTSKINLKDILEAEKKQEEKKKMISPYTRIRKNKINNEQIKAIVIALIMLTIILIVLKVMTTTKREVIINELSKNVEVRYE